MAEQHARCRPDPACVIRHPCYCRSAIRNCRLLTLDSARRHQLWSSHCLLLHIHRATKIQTMCNAPRQHRCRSSEGSLPADTHSAALVRSLSVCVSRSTIDWPCAGPW
jgi:hypothetical protein